MKQQLIDLLSSLLSTMGGSTIVPQVTRPDNATHGDYTTNVAMLVAKEKKHNPITIANELKKAIERQLATNKKLHGDQNSSKKSQTISLSDDENQEENILQAISKIEVAPPGFINVFLSEASLSTHVIGLPKSEKSARIRQKSTGKKIMVEYAHPNTHKAFHIGHLRNITTGECMARLLEAVGNKVIRVNYQGDVGLHIGKCLYGILHTPNGLLQLDSITSINGKVDFLANAYVYGAFCYEKGGEAKLEVERINKQIYAKDPTIYPLYEKTRQWSLDYFATIYKRVGTKFDHYYFESETYENGKQLVLDGVTKGIFQEDKGAVIFPGEKYGLHNRVFITGEGNPTYEAKDMGLAKLQFDDYQPSEIIHCVGSEQIGYFQVIIEALSHLMPETTGKEKHLVYGWVRLKEGKMSSRLGQVVLGETLLDNVKSEIQNILDKNDTKYSERDQNNIAEACAIAAVKYSFLKVGTTQDIAFDIKESVNVHGDSGPYLLYTFARCQSVLRKASMHLTKEVMKKLTPEEREVARLLLYFPEIVREAAEGFAPNMLCTYLFTLAQAFNLFYAKCPILVSNTELSKAERIIAEKEGTVLPSNNISSFRIILTDATAQIISQGLHMLGIPTIEKM